MLLGIDHVVIAVDDPDAAAADLERLAGLHSTGGGRHESLGTFNRLVWFGDSYLELIGVFDPDLAARSWIGAPALRALASGGGLVTWAVAADSLEHATVAWPSLSPAYRGPVNGERTRPDGRVVRWRLGIAGELGPSEPPFLIEHDTAAAEWTPPERAARALESHPAGDRVRLSGLVVDVARPHALAARTAALLGIEFRPSAGGVEARLGGQTVRFVARTEEPAPTEERRPAPASDFTVRLTSKDVSRVTSAESFGGRFELTPPLG